MNYVTYIKRSNKVRGNALLLIVVEKSDYFKIPLEYHIYLPDEFHIKRLGRISPVDNTYMRKQLKEAKTFEVPTKFKKVIETLIRQAQKQT